MLGQVEDFALSPTIDESGLKQLQKVLDNFYKQAQSSFSNADFANFEAIASESDIARLKTLTAEAAKYRRELETLQKSGSSERTDAYLLRTGKQDLLGRAQAQKGFDSTASLGKNALAMERAAESYQRSADTMQSAIDKLESEANAAVANAQQAAQQVNTLEQQSKVLAADTQAAKFHHAAGRFRTAIVANRGVENPTIGSVERGLRSALESVQANGKIATDARNAVGDWIKHLFPQLPTSDIASMIGQDINTLLSNLMEQIFGSGYLDTDVVYSPQHSAILSRAQDYSRSEINRIARIHSTANVLDLTARSQQVNSDLRKAKSSYTAYNNEADSKVTSWSEMVDQQEELIAAAQASSQLSQELYTLADAAQKAAIASKEVQIQQNAEAQQDLKEGAMRSTRQLAQQGKMAARQYQAADESFIGEANENLKGAKIDANEAEQFTNNLKQSVAHWMSAQQIVNLVKDGIRQAYQDIQGLDAAMTNIAVVTDMSVSDLWGKINEYMSIAQQYGVTTQGVYEVSQLYYQQGLTTNEVMAATTETLKMARIAGMGYAEAADAMTVAIRAFKMEMSDASHVTDVYSKVAAVTASDTEELAIAMSKTASSAESVGSSFENTTAMLAVMIETTRESAQNLGSALKSIISRYGEMKSGMTQDSEGEIIDYNKTDAALRSIGISLKDAQGQFRDFDDVIFELSAKWDSLDKNTQRYIATIMAGNRQQSRFIALVDNWERLEEVTGAAQDSEDAGLLQYAKTLDSLDTKLNNLKTSFQQFYMSIFDGEFFKGFIDIITNVIDNLSKMGPLLGGINLLQLINQIKLVGQLLLNTFSKNISKIQKSSKEWQNSFTNGWPSVGERIADVIAKAIVAKAVPTGKQFAEGVVQGAQGGQGQPQNVVPQKNQGQTVEIKNKYREQAQNYLKQIGLDFSVGNLFDQNGKLTKNAAREFLSPKKNSKVSNFDNLTQSYQKQADAILKASDQFDKTAVDWANKVKAAGNGFEAKMGAAGKQAYLTALKTADAEAEIELAAAKQAAAEQKKAATQQKWGQGLVMAGTALSSAGMMVDQSTMAGYDASTGLQLGGAAASTVGQFLTGNYIGAAISAITGVLTFKDRVENRAKYELENAEKVTKEANVERAQKREEARSIEETINNLKKLQKARYDSAEAEQAYLEASQAALEKYPSLTATYDAAGNAMVDVINEATTAEYLLINARQDAAEAATEAAIAELKEAEIQSDNAEKNSELEAAFFEGSGQWNNPWTGQEEQLNQLSSIKTSYIKEYGSYEENSPVDLAMRMLATSHSEDELARAYVEISEMAVEAQKNNNTELAEQLNWILKTSDTALSKIKGLYTGAKPFEEAEKIGYLGVYEKKRAEIAARNARVLNAQRVQAQAYANQMLTYSDPLEEGAWREISGAETAILSYASQGIDETDFEKDGELTSLAKVRIAERTQEITDAWELFIEGLSIEQIDTYNNLTESFAKGQISLNEYLTELAKLGGEFDIVAGTGNIAILEQARAAIGATNTSLLRIGKNLLNFSPSSEAERDMSLASDSRIVAVTLNGEIGQYTGMSLSSYDEWLQGDGFYTFEDNEENAKIYRQRLMNAQLVDYNEFIKRTGLEDSAASQQIYRDTLLNALRTRGLDENIIKILEYSSISVIEQYAASIEETEKLIEKDPHAAGIYTKRKDWLTWVYAELADENSEFFGHLEDQQKSALYQALATDTGTYSWANNFQQLLLGYGIELTGELENIEQYAYESYQIRLQGLIDGTSSVISSIKDLQEKQQSGFSWDEAEGYLRTLQKLDPSLTWEQVFKINEQGIITLIDFTKTVNDLYASQLSIITQEQNRLTELTGLVSGDELEFILPNDLKDMNVDRLDPVLEQALSFMGADSTKISTENWNQLRNAIWQGEIKTLEDLVNWFNQHVEEGYQVVLSHSENVENKFEQINKDSIVTAEEAAATANFINESYGLGLNDQELAELTTQIQNGVINSREALIEYFNGNLTLINNYIDYLNGQRQQILADSSFQQWGETFTSAKKAVDLSSIASGSFEDLQEIFIARLENDASSIFEQVEMAAPVYEVNDTYWQDGVYHTVNDGHALKGQIKDWRHWDDGDYIAYYTAQAKALELHGAALDAFGNLIITDWIKWGEYIVDSYGYSEAAIEQAIQSGDTETATRLSAARTQILSSAKASQIALQETTLNNIQDGLENLYTSLIEDGEIEFSEVENILTALQPKMAASEYSKLLENYEQAKAGTIQDFKIFIDDLANIARAQGYDINEDEIIAKIQDAYTSLVKTLFDYLSSAIEGSLSAEGLDSLELSLGLDLSAYQQQTLDGYRLSSEGLLKVAGELEQRYGNVAGYAEKMTELFVGEGKLYSGTEELEARIAAIEEAKKSEEGISEELEYQLSLLKKMAATSRLNENDPLFNFMDQDSTRGFAAGADQMISSIDKVKSTFSSITAGEQILADDFYNMMDFMYNNRAEGMQGLDDSSWLANVLGVTPEAIQQLSNKTGEATSVYEAFVNAVVSSSGELGKVDTEVLLEMGISMDTMSSSMSASLKEVAQDQIKFLENLRKTLEAYKALEDIGTIEMGTISIGGENVSINLDNFEDYLDKPEFTAKVGEFQQTLLTKLGEKFDVDGAQIANALFGGEFEFSNEEDRTVLQNLKAFFDRIKTFTSQEWQAFILSYPQLFTESGWDLKALSEVISSGLDFSDLLSGISSEAAANINAAIQGKTIANIELGSDNLTYKFTGAKEDWKATEQALQTLYQGQSVTAEFTLEGETVTVHYVNADVKATVDSLKKANFSGLSIDYNGELKQYLGTFTLEGQEINVSVDPSGIKFTGPDGSKIDETMQSAIEAQFTGMGAYNVTSELDENGVLNVTVSDASVDALATINTNVASIVDLLSAGIAISVDSEAANQALVTIQEAYNALKENVANNPIKISLEYDTPPELNLPPITRIVKLEYNNNSSNSSTDGESGAGAAGNFKAVAMTKAKGNVSALLNGAALAQGTLMGELGPELYVQGGQYQIAGANGPEFVDLAPDAIVFNHLQTANLLGKGHTTKTGSPITSERCAVGAYATGNVSGSAFANGSIASAIAAIDRAIAIWENIANITAADLAGGGGGGGGGGENSVKAVTEELVKWYNLSRQIEKLEQDINNILAERENIVDGGEYLRSLREQQKLLAQQAATQRTLLAYQEEQLERQKQHILNNKIWSQFLTFDESGNLQYIVGNESNGGQGQLNVLDQLNKMSGEEQLDYIKNTLGYSYTDQDGNVLDGEDLITKFFEELQGQIDSYDALFDTVNSTEEKLQEIQSTINEIDQEIEQNQMDLEQAIYDILVEAWEKQIEQMEEQMELVREANEAYIENLNKALSDERDMYSQNESIADRESLQNRLALLRRSGGSASEIYDLEQQLDDMLKDEYFNKQEEMIEHIEEANEEQIRKLEEQIKLEEEALEYQKENGVLWTQVYEIMRGTEESILAFMQGNSPEFFSQSTLQQKKMLTDWAKQIGIYTEDQQYKNYQREAEDTHWDSNSWRANISEGGVGQELAAIFDGLDADQYGTLKNLFTSTYANEMLESGDENAALTAAIEALKAQLRNIQAQQAETATGGNDGGNGTGGGAQNPSPSPSQSPKRYRVDYTVVFVDNQTKTGYGVGGSESEALAAAKYWAKKHTKSPKDDIHPGGAPVRNTVYSKAYAYKQGGLVDYTGPAIVHGTPSKPEAFLNAKQTAMISEAVRTVGDGGALNGIKATLAALNSTIKGIVNNDNSLTSSFTVAPGAITIQVAQLSDSYDVEELSKDVMNRMVAIAQRATNRGVNRR